MQQLISSSCALNHPVTSLESNGALGWTQWATVIVTSAEDMSFYNWWWGCTQTVHRLFLTLLTPLRTNCRVMSCQPGWNILVQDLNIIESVQCFCVGLYLRHDTCAGMEIYLSLRRCGPVKYMAVYGCVVWLKLHTNMLVSTALPLLKRSQGDFTKTRLVYWVVATVTAIWLKVQWLILLMAITHWKPVLYSAVKGVIALMNGSLHTACLFYIFLMPVNTCTQSLLGPGQVSNQYCRSILFSVGPSLLTHISFTERPWGESSVHKQSLNPDFLSFVLCTFLSLYCDQRSLWWSDAACLNVFLSSV